MTLKNAVANSLLMFVAATCVVLIVKALPQNSAAPQPASGPAPGLSDGVVVYYFHRNVRCPTCRSIEAYAYEAVHSGFAEELKDRRLQWQVINYEAPGNEHFATDYELAAPNVVLVKCADGKQTAWKALPEVWELVGDKAAFVSFVQDSLRTFLHDSAKAAAGDPPPPLPTSSDSDAPPLPE